MTQEAERYATIARALIKRGNELRDMGVRGRDTDMTLTPTSFLELLADAWDEGFDSGRWCEGDWPTNPYAGGDS